MAADGVSSSHRDASIGQRFGDPDGTVVDEWAAREAEAIFNDYCVCAIILARSQEEHDNVANRMLGNFPQAFPPVGLIDTAHNLLKTNSPNRERAQLLNIILLGRNLRYLLNQPSEDLIAQTAQEPSQSQPSGLP